ncbi:hypothetical protein WME75_26275 [Sorangium sp. So ce1014]|uniref:hypothetical protein n=1 Tax=Sorangium sp. So ce1014 TaxID=3133326 RepID=UPI003F5F6685
MLDDFLPALPLAALEVALREGPQQQFGSSACAEAHPPEIEWRAADELAEDAEQGYTKETVGPHLFPPMLVMCCVPIWSPSPGVSAFHGDEYTTSELVSSTKVDSESFTLPLHSVKAIGSHVSSAPAEPSAASENPLTGIVSSARSFSKAA